MNQPVFQALTSRWTKLRAHAEQHRYWNSPHRFNTLPAGRRSGKTELFKRKLVKRAIRGTKFEKPRFFASAPTFSQAKRIYWDDLKRLIPPGLMAGAPSESELVIRLITGSEIYIIGMDKPERFEGQPWDGGGLDEYANMKAKAWGENVRPALSDRLGWCDLIGVPEGRNHYYDTDKMARQLMEMEGDDSQWGAFHWKSADILPASEIESARNDLDPLTFEQEYEASFVNFVGRAYYAFLERTHCAKLKYDPRKAIAFCFDFNVDPGVVAVCQEQMLPSGVYGTGVIGEVYIPQNSNTEAVCRKLARDWVDHMGPVVLYGDATGGARKTSQTSGNDWDIVMQHLRPIFKDRLTKMVPPGNPSVRSRINAVNTRLRTHGGQIKLMVDPLKAPHVVKDLEGVRLLEGGAGEIDKKADPKLSHISDALGYMVEKEFPVKEAVKATSGHVVGTY